MPSIGLRELLLTSIEGAASPVLVKGFPDGMLYPAGKLEFSEESPA